MALAQVLAAAGSNGAALQIVLAAVLGGGGLAAIAAFRKAKPEAELSTVQSMKIALEETRTERDEARKDRDVFKAKWEATSGHAMYLERRVEALENRLRIAQLEIPPTPRRDSDEDDLEAVGGF